MKVLFQSRKTLFSEPGGDTTQLLKTKEYLEKLGVEVSISLDLTPDVSSFDIVHVFNLMRPQELYLQVLNAKKYKKKVALSTIYGPYEEYEKKGRGGLLGSLNKLLSIDKIEYLKVVARAILNWEFNKGTVIYLLKGHKRLQRKIIKMTDVFLPNSDSEMLRVAKDFALQTYNYVSIANAVDISIFDYDKVEIDPEMEKFRDCILCVSRIEGRKNQLNVIRACKDLPYKFVYVGKSGANFKKYFEQCKSEANENTIFTGPIPHEKLPQLYKLARVHTLVSWMETPGLSSLEAGVMHTNIVVTRKGDPEEYFKDYAFYCEPDDLVSIREAVKAAYEAPFDENLYEHIIANYKWEDAARQTLHGYESCFN